jgi:high-affinity nickel-transport protein
MDLQHNEWAALATLATFLGARHGFDADHLVTIDGLTRYNAVEAPGLARWCGVLFSLGHGAVVMAVAVGAGLAAARWQVPEWLEQTGAWISIGFLTLLGAANLAAVVCTPRHEVVRTFGLKGALFARLQRTRNPWLIGSIGALFALSFDTLSQAALFAVAAMQFGGVVPAATLAACFVAGMLAADGANGAWIAALIRRADRRERIASRIFGAAIASLCLVVAAIGAGKVAVTDVDAWLDGRELALGVAVIAIVALCYAVAVRWPRARVERAGTG